MGKTPSQREILQPVFTLSDISVPNPTTIMHRFRTAGVFILFLHSQIIYTSLTLIFPLNLHIQ